MPTFSKRKVLIDTGISEFVCGACGITRSFRNEKLRDKYYRLHKKTVHPDEDRELVDVQSIRRVDGRVEMSDNLFNLASPSSATTISCSR